MRRKSFVLAFASVLGITVGLVGPAAAAPLGTAFTFQGRLTDGGNPANGVYDLQFSLWDAVLGGAQVGSTICSDNVSVSNGLFTVSLDFGAQFNGEARWLQIGARAGGAAGNCAIGAYTVLSPRQPLTAAPYALGLRLPLVETTATNSDALSITTTGTGDGFQFNISNPASAGEALEGRTDGTGDAVQGINTGTGRAGFFQISNASSSAAALECTTNGSGAGVEAVGHFGISASASDADGYGGIFGGSGFLGGGQALFVFGDSQMAGSLGIGVGAFGNFTPEAKLHVHSTSDSSPAGGGIMVLGLTDGANVSFDANEIMARNNGAVSTLFLNHGGGEVRIGQGSAGTGKLLTPVLQITGGSDLSENFEVATEGDTTAESGMVVCIDVESPGKLTPCTKAYDRTVAGVISGAGGVKPGMLMGQSGTIADGAHPVALTGRVYVRCDAREQAIEVGDLLTTSGTPGQAMKVRDHARAQGAIIGKAMTGLAEGRGLVLVLVQPQ